MKQPLICLAVLVAMGVAGPAQQPNSGPASLVINGVNGPTFPMDVTVNTGSQTALIASGAPNVPFALAISPTLMPTGHDLGDYGLFDLDWNGFTMIANGWLNPLLYSTNASGQWAAPYSVPTSGIPNGTNRSFQAIVLDLGNPVGLTLTAASRVTINQAQIVINHSIPRNGFVSVNLAPYGLSMPFYTGNYTSYWVNCNGTLSYTGGDYDFTASLGEFHSLKPRIAPKWTDLDPGAGGTVKTIIDNSVTPPTITLQFNAVKDWYYLTPPPSHTFDMVFQTQTGNITINQSAQSPGSIYDTVVGISPGGNQSPTQAAKDFTALKAGGGMVGAVKESFPEIFRGVGTTSPWPNWDLTGVTLDFIGISLGTPQCFYVFF